MKTILVFKVKDKFDQEVSEIFTRSDIKIDISDYSDIEISIIDNTIKIIVGGKNIDEWSLVYFRNREFKSILANTIAIYLQSKGVPFLDKMLGQIITDNKLIDSTKLAINGFPIPDTIFFSSAESKEERYERIVSQVGSPFIMKSASGQLGNNNFLIRDLQDYVNKIQDLSISSLDIIYQRFIDNVGDFRLVVIGDKVKVLKKRERINPESTHLNNVAKGAKITILNPEEYVELCKLATESSKLLNRQITGVDIVVSSKSNLPYILEVNIAPSYRSDLSILNEYVKYFHEVIDRG